MTERDAGEANKNSVVFSLKNQVGGLARALQVFQVREACTQQIFSYFSHGGNLSR